MAENNSSAPLKTAGEPFVALGECIADQVCLSVAELPDRNSPADWPQAMLVTSDELRTIVLNAINYAAQAVAAVAVPDERAAFEDFYLAEAGKHIAHPEKWTRKQKSDAVLIPLEDGTYGSHAASVAWKSWQARAALASTPEIPVTEDSSAGDLAEATRDDEGISRGDWLAQAERLYLAVGDTLDEARMCASYLYNEQDWDGFGGDDPIHAALDDVEGRGPQVEVQAEPVAAIKDVMELVKALVTSVNEAHHANSDGWRDVCFASAGQLVTQIEEKLGKALLAPVVVQAEPVAVTTHAELQKLQARGVGSPVGTMFHPAAEGFPVKLYTAPQAQPANALDSARLDFLEARKYRDVRDGGYSAAYSVHLPAMAAGPWQASHGGEYDHKSLREAIDAAMAAAQEGGNAAKEA